MAFPVECQGNHAVREIQWVTSELRFRQWGFCVLSTSYLGKVHRYVIVGNCIYWTISAKRKQAKMRHG